MNLQPTLEDELILMRPLAENDFEALFEVAKDPLIWEQHPNWDRYKREVFIEFFSGAMESKGAFLILDKESEKVIGSTRFKKVEGAEDAIEIGWSFLARDTWGGKYNRSMKKLMINYALDHMEHIIFYIGKENMRSRKAVEKLGGRQITSPELDHLVRKNGIDLTYRIGKEDWKS